MDADEALELLRKTHVFPGEFEFRVVAMPEAEAALVTAITASAGAPAKDVSRRPSRTGKYVAISVRVEVASAEMVLETWAVVKGVPGVLASL